MEKKFKASIEIVHFECSDIITTSGDHDNGYVDGGGLTYFKNDMKNIVDKIF